MVTQPKFHIDSLESFKGSERGASAWQQVTQAQIEDFADCTGDHQWIHVDAARAEKESPFGTTIAHGYLVLSLLGKFMQEIDVFPAGVSQVLNYGFEKVRFLTPVKPGDRVRARIAIRDVQDKGGGRKIESLHCTIDVEGQDTPAVVADVLVMLVSS